MNLRTSLLTPVFLVFILTVSVALTSCGSAMVEETQQISLEAAQYTAIPLKLKPGDLVEGSFVVGGASDLDIAFSVKDPSANEILPYKRYRSYTFTFRAQQKGVHYLNFDKSYSLFTGKTLSVTTKHPRR